jgi:flagellar hook-associated protein 2
MEAERMPLKQMEERKQKLQEKKALVGELTKLMEGLRTDVISNSNARSLRELKVETNEGIVGVNLDKNLAGPGNYQLEVLELAQKSTAMSSGFEDAENSYVGVGFIKFTLPNGDTKEIFIDPENASLKGIAKVINGDSSNGITANVVNDGSGEDKPWRLTLSVEGTGEENKATFPYFYFIDGDQDFYLEYERPAKNAKIKFNGFEMEVPSNKLDTLIPGAVIDLKRAKPGEEFGINITEDRVAVTEKVNAMVEKINGVLTFIKQQNTLDQSTDTSRTLGGDSILQSIESRLRSVVFKDVITSKGPRRIGDLGITFQKSGLLQMDAKKFESQISQDYQVVSEILTGIYYPDGTKELGFIDNLRKYTDTSLQQPNGILKGRELALRSNMDRISRQISSKERLLTQKEENLKSKFARLETTISQMKNQSAGLGALASQISDPVQNLS